MKVTQEVLEKRKKARRRWAARRYDCKIRTANAILDDEPGPELSHLLSIGQEHKRYFDDKSVNVNPVNH